MKRNILTLLQISLVTVTFSQTPSFTLGTDSKYYDFKKTFVSNDFKNASQIRIGSYLTLGNFGFTNSSWIGSNAILDYTSYGDVGSLGNKNFFIPHWNVATALVLELSYVNGTLKGFNHTWNGLSSRVDFLDFEKIWEFGKTDSFFLSNLGIGTTTPDAKLTVKGDIHAEQVRVDLSVPGPDYVLKEGYPLKPLKEVQHYIQQHGHLPNIPSAREMQENGILLGEMNMKLLEKIEELTLYIIDLEEKNRVISQLQEELKHQKELLIKIEAQLTKKL